MGSNLQQSIQKQQEKTQEKTQGFTNWRDIKSPTVRDQFYNANKEAIDKFEALKAEAEKLREELNVTSIEEYETEYNKLNSELKPFFATPQKIREEQESIRIANIGKTQEEINKTNEKLTELEKKYNEDKIKLQEWWQRKSDKYRDNRSNRENYNENMDDLEDDFEEKRAYYIGYQEKLGWGQAQLNSGKQYTYNQIQDYADSYGSYKERREEARNDQRNMKEKFSKEIEDTKNSKDWQEYAKNYAKLPKLIKDMFTAPASSQMKNYFQQKQEYESFGKQGLTPIYKNGKLAGFEDSVLGMSYDINAYEKTFKDQRNKYEISYDANKNTISWSNKIKEDKPTFKVDITPTQTINDPELIRKLEKLELDTKIGNYLKYAYPQHQTRDYSITPKMINEGKYLLDVTSGTSGRQIEKNAQGDFIRVLPMEFGKSSIDNWGKIPVLKNVEKWAIDKQKETMIGQLKLKEMEIINEYGDKYGLVKPEKLSEKKLKEYNQDVEEYNQMKSQDIEKGAWQGYKDRAKYWASKGLQLVNPESLGELGAEAGVALGAYYAFPYVAGSVASLEASYPIVATGVSGGFFGKNVYDAYKGYKEQDWTKMSGGINLGVLGALDFAPRMIKIGKNLYVKTGATQVQAEKYFDNLATKNLKEGGKVTLPKAKNVDEIIKEFEKTKEGGKYYGISASKVKILEKSDDGKQALVYLEGTNKRIEDDALLWISARGKGSPYFLKLPHSTSDLKYTLNPFKDIVNPNAYNIAFDKIKRLPKGIIEEARKLYGSGSKAERAKAYAFVNKYLSDKKGIYIPLRTEFWETPEIQAIIAPSTKVIRDTSKLNGIAKWKGYGEYTKLRGYNIPIRPYQVVKGTEHAENIIKATNEINMFKRMNEKYYNYIENLYSNPYQLSKYASILSYPKKKDYSKTTEKSYPKESYTPSYPKGSAPYIPYENYGFYNPSTSYNSYYPNSPMGESRLYTETKVYPKLKKDEKNKKKKSRKEELKEQEAYQPIYYTEDGAEIEGAYYPNWVEATAEGFDTVDQTPLEKFNIRKVLVRREMLSRHQGTKAGYKFKSKGNLYIEKVPYRKDTKREGKFNIMPYVFNSH